MKENKLSNQQSNLKIRKRQTKPKDCEVGQSEYHNGNA